MAALGTLFPLEVSGWGANIRYSTDIIIGKNGQEVRNALWQDPLYSFNASFAVKALSDVDTLQTFFHGVKGREQSFLVKDHNDYKVAPWEVFAETADGVRTTFQLIKRYVQGVAPTFTRTITKPKAIEGVGGVRIRDNGVELLTTAFSFSSVTGIVTIPVPPISGHTLDFSIDEFYVPVRFDIDELPVELLTFWVSSGADYANINVPEIPMKEIRGE